MIPERLRSLESMVPEKMNAWQYSKFGGGAESLKLVEVPVPKPGKGQFLVKVQAFCINPVDWKIQQGVFRPLIPFTLPYTPGSDIAGEVVELGVGVKEVSVGDSVFGWCDVQRGGAYAQFAVVDKDTACKRPESVSPETACCLPVAGLAALQALRDKASVPVDKGGYSGNILVANSTGGVGHYAVQLAKLAGAHVTATCSASNAPFVRSLGADEALDYKTPDGESLRSPSGKKFDVILDGLGHGLPWQAVKSVLTPRGTWLLLTPGKLDVARAVWFALTWSSQRMVPFLMSARAADLELLARLSEQGKLQTHFDTKFKFKEMPSAWVRSMEGHVLGKVVVQLQQ